MTQPLSFSVRADLFRVAQAFPDAPAGVRIEPLSDGGVVMVGMTAGDLIAVVDRSGEANRAGTVSVGKALVNMAVDLFRRDGVEVRLRGENGIAFIEPDPAGNAARNFEVAWCYPDWRALLASYATCRLEPPLTINARITARLSTAAIGLARAAHSDDESVTFKGGQMAMVAEFSAWPEAVALFGDTRRRVAIDAGHSTMWRMPAWASPHQRLAAAGE